MVALRAFHLAAVMLAYGAFVFALLLGCQPDGSGAASEMREELGRRLYRLALAGAALSLLSWLTWLGLVAEEMSGLPLERALAPSVLGLPVVVPPAGEYVADGAARQAAWVLAGGPTPPAWRFESEPELLTGEPTPHVREQYAAARDLVVERTS